MLTIHTNNSEHPTRVTEGRRDHVFSQVYKTDRETSLTIFNILNGTILGSDIDAV